MPRLLIYYEDRGVRVLEATIDLDTKKLGKSVVFNKKLKPISIGYSHKKNRFGGTSAYIETSDGERFVCFDLKSVKLLQNACTLKEEVLCEIKPSVEGLDDAIRKVLPNEETPIAGDMHSPVHDV